MAEPHNKSPKTASPQDGGDTEIRLEDTVGLLANRIARKLKEKDAQQSQQDRATETRKNLILEAMSAIRKALQETLRINLGERFSLDLDIDDCEGWPRIQLCLIDSYAPEQIDHALVASASDRKGLGTIEISTKSGKNLSKVNLTERSDLNKLPAMLKKSVRDFLEIIAVYILNPVRPDQMLQVQAKAIDTGDTDILGSSLKNTDLFEDKVSSNENFVSAVHTIAPLEPAS